MAISKSLVFGFLLLATLALVKAEPEANPSYGKPAAKVVHYHEEPVSRYVYSRHVHYEPAHDHVVKYYAYPHVHEAYVNHHHEHLVDYHHHH